MVNEAGLVFSFYYNYLLPKYKKSIPMSTNNRSTNLALRFFSWKRAAPKRKLTMTLPRLTMLTMLIMAPGRLSA